MQLYDELVARGLIAQVTNEEEIREMEEELKVIRQQVEEAKGHTVEPLDMEGFNEAMEAVRFANT